MSQPSETSLQPPTSNGFSSPERDRCDQAAASLPVAAVPGITELLTDLIAEVRGLRADLAERSASVSSVEIDSNNKTGDTKIKVKKYADSQPPVDETLEDFAFGMREIQRLQLANWQETVEALNGRP